MKLFIKGVLALGAVGAVLAGCSDDDDGGPTVNPTATSVATTSATSSATSSATASATATAGGGLNVVALSREASGDVLLGFNSATPGTITSRRVVSNGVRLAGIDVRPVTGELFGLGTNGTVYTVGAASGVANAIGSTPVPYGRGQVGFDFNPVPDRIRIVTDAGANLRANPLTGGPVDGDATTPGRQDDGTLAFAISDTNVGRAPALVGAAYTNSQRGAAPAGTTNFAIDRATGTLVTQGTRQGAATPVSPNTGQLFTVGSLGVPINGQVGFDIGGSDNLGLVSINNVLFSINLTTGAATRIGTIGTGRTVIAGLAILQ